MLIDESPLDSRVSVDPAVTQERPVTADVLQTREIHLAEHDFLFIAETLGDAPRQKDRQ